MSGTFPSFRRLERKVVDIFAVILVSKPFQFRIRRFAHSKDIAEIEKRKQRVGRPHRFRPRKNAVCTLVIFLAFTALFLRLVAFFGSCALPKHPHILVRVDNIYILVGLKILYHLMKGTLCHPALR